VRHIWGSARLATRAASVETFNLRNSLWSEETFSIFKRPNEDAYRELFANGFIRRRAFRWEQTSERASQVEKMLILTSIAEAGGSVNMSVSVARAVSDESAASICWIVMDVTHQHQARVCSGKSIGRHQ